MVNMKCRIMVSGFLIVLMIFFCGQSFAVKKTLLMATTTSTDNTGLLDYLSPLFTKSTGVELKWTAVGTGKALALAQNCDVDVLMVHAPNAEKTFIQKGFGMSRRLVMFNDFVIIGPSNDPMKIKGKNLFEALKILFNKKARFISRGDNSGTHKKEMMLWEKAGVAAEVKQKWYRQTGQGMLATIRVAAEMQGYTLVDRGTFIKYQDTMKEKLTMAIVVEKDDLLKNQYSVILTNPKHCNNAKVDLARKFSDWITGAEAQRKIKEFRLLGKQLFIPNAVK